MPVVPGSGGVPIEHSGRGRIHRRTARPTMGARVLRPRAGF